ncbi:MAG: GtrA family protein [Actinobacteria bacterium]|nr:GtrA family protein [Actinomycetota bacterium]
MSDRPATRLSSVYRSHGDKLRFLVVGGWNTLFSYALFLALLATIGPPLSALEDSPSKAIALMGRDYYVIVQWVCWVAAVPQSTLAIKFFAFHSKGNWRHEIGRAYFVYLPAQLLSTVILWLAVRVANLGPHVGQIIAIGVTVVFSYLGHKYFTFRVPLEVGEVPPQQILEGTEPPAKLGGRS